MRQKGVGSVQAAKGCRGVATLFLCILCLGLVVWSDLTYINCSFIFILILCVSYPISYYDGHWFFQADKIDKSIDNL